MIAFSMRVCILVGVLLAHTAVEEVAATSTPGSSSDDKGGNFTIVNGQIFTPGLAIIDAPQPFTPLGGGKCTYLNRIENIYISST